MWDDLTWGLQMMLVGMGAVFALLLALMLVLMLIGRLDRPEPEPTPELSLRTGPEGSTEIVLDHTGLDPATIAAIAVAVVTHAEHRRRQAGPEVRAHPPGSQLFASRWVSVGRSHQTQPFRRN